MVVAYRWEYINSNLNVKFHAVYSLMRLYLVNVVDGVVLVIHDWKNVAFKFVKHISSRANNFHFLSFKIENKFEIGTLTR